MRRPVLSRSSRRLGLAALIALLTLFVAAGGGAACGSRGPAWPKSAGTVAVSEWSEDGGESIAPHTARAAAVEKSAEPETETKAVEAPAPKPAEPAAEGSGAGSADSEAPIELLDEVIGEEIIIEIED